MLKIYTDLSVIPEGIPPAEMLRPFLPPKAPDVLDPDAGRWDNYMKVAPQHLMMVPTAEEADICVCPVQFEHPIYKVRQHNWQPLWDWSEKALTSGKPVVGFLVADLEDPIGNGRGLIFRTSENILWRKANEYGYPAMVADLGAVIDEMEEPPGDPPAPTIGFCGYVSEAREKTIAQLRGQKEIPFNFISRDKFYGNADRNQLIALREEYVRNIRDNMYSLCIRGGGNFSYRLFEVMSAGRIPVYIDTGGLLPAEEIIPWKDLMVWVSPGMDPAECVRSFHARHPEDQLRALQQEIRSYWKTYLSPEGFHCTSLKHVLEKHGHLKLEGPIP